MPGLTLSFLGGGEIWGLQGRGLGGSGGGVEGSKEVQDGNYLLTIMETFWDFNNRYRAVESCTHFN